MGEEAGEDGGRDLDTRGERKRVAIACQGGGSHTAFTAGVLKRLLRAEELKRHKVVGLSGTSGGAVCALLAWHYLLRGEGARAAEALDAFWRDNSATAPHEQMVNHWIVWTSNLQNFVTMPAISPYDNYFSGFALDEFRRMLERRMHFEKVEMQPEESYPMLLVGAVDVLSGEFRAFNSRRDRISPETILASAAIPTLFRSVHLDDGGTYWDGLFSQNPPVRELTDEGPDEIWVIQINPKELGTEPKTVTEIADRRNELSGNLSLHQELRSIEKIDQLLEDGLLSRDGKYKQIVVRIIELSRSRFSRSLGTASKLNRDPRFIEDLMSHGEAQAEEFLAALAFEDAWRRRDSDAVMGFFTEDAQLVSSAPFSGRGPYKGRVQIRPFVTEHLAEEVRMDLTKKQVARDRVAWAVKALTGVESANRVEGVAEAEFRGRKLKALRLGNGPRPG
ncbi:MAG: patatin-like phospholipase family protein [Actinomycetota bacterium]|nr:patatin-like phospholipase family protein [Actinomycetota bacterium]